MSRANAAKSKPRTAPRTDTQPAALPAHFDPRSAWREGLLVIVATAGEGPALGQSVACTVSRPDFLTLLRDAHASARTGAADIPRLAALQATVYAAISNHLTALHEAGKTTFMRAVADLMAAKCVVGEAVLTGSGLFFLGLAVDPDTTQPWHLRGLIAPGHEHTPSLFATKH